MTTPLLRRRLGPAMTVTRMAMTVMAMAGLMMTLTLLSGCASTAGDESAGQRDDGLIDLASEPTAPREKTPEQKPVEEMYSAAAAALDSGKFQTAAQLFDDVERQYPYSQWATRAQMMAAYAHYRALSYDEALLALDRFIQLHPGDSNIAYAYYLRALCYYEQISDVRRDQKMTELALESLEQVSARFPETRYAKDARLKIDLTRDHLAGKDMEIGRYYLLRGHYNAAITRFQSVVDNHQTTTHVPEALHRLVEAYLALGIRPEAEKAASVLGYNYPDSSWYKDSYRLLTGKDASDDDATSAGAGTDTAADTADGKTRWYRKIF